MPKAKTHKGAAKRFRVTATGKIVRKRAFKSHLLEKKPAKRKRKFRKEVLLTGANKKQVRKLLAS